MLNLGGKVLYRAFGLSITSEISLPELLQVSNLADNKDVVISIEDLSKKTVELTENQFDFVINEKLVMFQVPDIAIFLIQDGSKIIVSPLKDYDVDVARLYILGSCMGAVLMQRKIFPLHGSAVSVDGKAYAIIGESGAGKSTLASAFINEGFQLLTDDVIALNFSEVTNKPFVTPSYPQQKLWQESLHEFGMDSKGYRPLYKRETKFAIPVTAQFSSEPLPLAGVFELVKSESEILEFLPIENLARLHTLFLHTYRNSLISKLGLIEWHFKNSTKIINHVDMYRIKRPINSFTANQIVSLILKIINTEEITC